MVEERYLPAAAGRSAIIPALQQDLVGAAGRPIKIHHSQVENTLMRLETRKLLDKAFSGFGLIAIAVMALALVLILAPIIWRGSKAYVFKGTIEHRRVMLEQFDRGNPEEFNRESAAIVAARAPVYRMLEEYAAETAALEASLEAAMETKKEMAKAAKAQARALKQEGGSDARIEELEAEQHEIATRLGDPASYKGDGSEISELKDRLQTVETDLATAYERWEQLEAVAEQE